MHPILSIMYSYDRRGPIVVTRVATSARAEPVNIADDESYERALREAASCRAPRAQSWPRRYARDEASCPR